MTFDEMWEKLRKSYPDVVARAEEYANKLNGFVDKNSAINAICFDCTEQDHCKDFCADARRILDLPVSLDVLPVVRCEKCSYWNDWDSTGKVSLGNYRCSCAYWTSEDGPTWYTAPTDFCSYGERKEVDDDVR